MAVTCASDGSGEAFGLLIAVVRSLPGPVLFPVRALATLYVDVLRAIPGLLIIYVLGFGIPGLGIAGVPPIFADEGAANIRLYDLTHLRAGQPAPQQILETYHGLRNVAPAPPPTLTFKPR